MSGLTVTMPDIWKYGDGTIKLALVGDVQSGPSRQAVADLIASWHVNAIVTQGDNVEGGHASDFTTVYAPWLSRGDLFPVPGNHDYETIGGTDDCGSAYFATFPIVSNAYYYQLNLGPVTFFMLNSHPANLPDSPSIGGAQDRWFQRSAAASNAIWKVANFHHPPYTSYTPYGNNTWMRWDFSEMDLVMSGHVHLYERMLFGTLNYITNISGGKSKRAPGVLLPQSQFTYYAMYGAMLWEVSQTKLVAQLRNLDNAVVDQLILEK
jgi:hypothetical protein